MRSKVTREEAIGMAKGELLGSDLEGRLEALDREERVNAMLEELKSRRRLPA
jgi:hypothetical protein